jgi:hypothetical protein
MRWRIESVRYGRVTDYSHLTGRLSIRIGPVVVSRPLIDELPTNQELTGVESFGHISEKPVLRPSGKLPHCPSSA